MVKKLEMYLLWLLRYDCFNIKSMIMLHHVLNNYIGWKTHSRIVFKILAIVYQMLHQ